MPERKTLGSITAVTDTETSSWKMGEVEGGFDEEALKKHIISYGKEELLEKLAYMTSQVVLTSSEIERSKRQDPYLTVASC